jgi:hypothetical protein
MKLTKANIDRLTLAPGQSEIVKSSDDIPGLRFRIRASGARSWEYKFGSFQRISLGKYPAISPIAHKTAAECYAKVLRGENPALQIAEARARQSETFGSVVAIYLERRQPYRGGKGRSIA